MTEYKCDGCGETVNGIYTYFFDEDGTCVNPEYHYYNEIFCLSCAEKYKLLGYKEERRE